MSYGDVSACPSGTTSQRLADIIKQVQNTRAAAEQARRTGEYPGEREGGWGERVESRDSKINIIIFSY